MTARARLGWLLLVALSSALILVEGAVAMPAAARQAKRKPAQSDTASTARPGRARNTLQAAGMATGLLRRGATRQAAAKIIRDPAARRASARLLRKFPELARLALSKQSDASVKLLADHPHMVAPFVRLAEREPQLAEAILELSGEPHAVEAVTKLAAQAPETLTQFLDLAAAQPEAMRDLLRGDPEVTGSMLSWSASDPQLARRAIRLATRRPDSLRSLVRVVKSDLRHLARNEAIGRKAIAALERNPRLVDTLTRALDTLPASVLRSTSSPEIASAVLDLASRHPQLVESALELAGDQGPLLDAAARADGGAFVIDILAFTSAHPDVAQMAIDVVRRRPELAAAAVEVLRSGSQELLFPGGGRLPDPTQVRRLLTLAETAPTAAALGARLSQLPGAKTAVRVTASLPTLFTRPGARVMQRVLDGIAGRD